MSAKRTLPPPPYKGLVPYSEEDAALFFGRDSERTIINANLISSRFTLLYGPSGVGKSSVVNAGVAYNLRQRSKQNLQRRGTPEFAVAVFNAWRDDPVAGMLAKVEEAVNQLVKERKTAPAAAAPATQTAAPAAKLPPPPPASTAGGGAGKPPPPPMGSPSAASADRPANLPPPPGAPTAAIATKSADPAAKTAPPTFADRLRALSERVGGDLLIILDQFEDYFLYHPQDLDGDPGTFAYEFPRAVSDSTLRANFLVSIREDAVAKLDRFEGRIPTLFENYIRIDHLDRDSARDAIVKPIDQYNKSLLALAPDQPPVSIEPALVDAVLDQVKTGQVMLAEGGRGKVEQDGTGDEQEDRSRIETPFLQLVMTRLWDEEARAGSRTLRLETLTRLGGAETIVRTHLDNTMNALPSDEREAAARAFHYLVTPSGTKIAHTSRDLAAYVGMSESKLTPMLEKLTSSEFRILRAIPPPPDHLNDPPRYEIFHDVLAPSMLDWRRRYLQKKQTRRVRAIGALIGAAAVLVIGFLVFNLVRSQRDLQQKASEAQALSQAILAEPTGVSLAAPSVVALRATAAAVATSSAKVVCPGAPTIDFTAAETTIDNGGSTSLKWTGAKNVDSVTIDPGIGKVDSEGEFIIDPTTTTTYKLTASGCGGSVNKSVTVNVAAAPASAVPATKTPLPLASPTAKPLPTKAATAVPTFAPPTATVLSAPPGLYVTDLTVEPADPRAGQPIVFHPHFLNSFGSVQTSNYCVEIFNADDESKSIGISTCLPQQVAAGTPTMDSTGWNVTRIGACTPYRARTVWLDDAKHRTPFQEPDGTIPWLSFQLCP